MTLLACLMEFGAREKGAGFFSCVQLVLCRPLFWEPFNLMFSFAFPVSFVLCTLHQWVPVQIQLCFVELNF